MYADIYRILTTYTGEKLNHLVCGDYNWLCFPMMPLALVALNTDTSEY